MMEVLKIVLCLLFLSESSLSCPAHCAICLNTLYICNKWKSTYDLSSHSEISAINSNAFINANQMINLDISTNAVSVMETNAFNGLVSLQTLNLSHNALTALPDGIFQPLISLQTLDLSHNSINELNPGAFTGLTNLTKLYLNSNQLSGFSAVAIDELFNNLPSLQNITLSANNWHCDCNLTQLQAVLLSSSSKVADGSAMVCHTPSDLSNSLITGLNFYSNPLCFTSSPSPSPSPFLSLSSSLISFTSSDTLFSLSPSPTILSSSLEVLSPSPSLASSSIVMSPVFPLISSSLSSYSPLISLSSSIEPPPLSFFSSFFIASSTLVSTSSPSIISPYYSETISLSSTSYSLSLSSSSVMNSTSTTVAGTAATSTVAVTSTAAASSTTAVTSTAASSVISYTTTITNYQSSTTVASTPTTASSTVTPSATSPPVQTTTSSISPTPTPLPHCTSNASVTNVGLLVWPHTMAGRSVSVPCPYGPSNAHSTRYCVLIPSTGDAVWGALELGACFTANNRLQLLIHETVTDSNVLSLSEELADIPFDHLSDNGIDNFITIASRVFQYGNDNITVVVNVLSAIDLLLDSSNVQNLISLENFDNIHTLITTALFGAVNANNTQQILQFSRLLIGAKYVQETEVIAEVEVLGEGRLSFVPAGANVSGEIIIDIRSNELGGHTVQVTIYNDTTLFSSGCLSLTSSHGPVCNAQIASPIAVTTVNGLLGDEKINITFENIMTESSSMLHCAMWNASNIDGGQWDSSGCSTNVMTNLNSVQCSCTASGTVAVLQIISINGTNSPTNGQTPSSPFGFYASLVFYVSGGLSALLHLPIIIVTAKISYKYEIVRNIQALLHHSITQMIVFIAMIISFQRNEIQQLCLALGSFLHYIILVSYLWMIFRVVITCMSQIRYKKLYERDCFILPFFFIAWSLPILPVVIYGVMSFTDTRNEYTDIQNCWIESFAFPNYFMYLCLVNTLLLALLLLISFPLLACSSFVINTSSYYQLLGLLIETLFFSGMVAIHFMTAHQQSEVLISLLCGMMLLTSGYYFVSNGFARNKTRKAILCQEGRPYYSKGRPFTGQETPTTTPSSTMSEVAKKRRQMRQVPFAVRLSHEMNMDYLGGYYGYPIELWSEVGEGRRVRKKTEFFTDHRKRGSSEV